MTCVQNDDLLPQGGGFLLESSTASLGIARWSWVRLPSTGFARETHFRSELPHQIFLRGDPVHRLRSGTGILGPALIL